MTRWDIGCEEATECLEFGQKLRSVVLLPSFPVLPPAFPASCQKVFFKPFDPPRSLRGDALFASWVSERVAAKVPFSSLTSLFTTLTALCFSPSSQLVCGSHCVGGIGSKKAEESALSQAAVATVVVPPHLKRCLLMPLPSRDPRFPSAGESPPAVQVRVGWSGTLYQ